MDLDQDAVRTFQEKVMNWWKDNARDLPWRESPSPYEVLISEVMLQQTQVSRVVPKYIEFLKEFPDLESLASANTKHLLTVWSGLGYNRRALWLKEAASQILELGLFPTEVNELQKLKGIGPYTSRSILIFAFNKDLATVDTNIRRVLIASGFACEETNEKELLKIADALLLRGRSSDWHNALMDYGSAVLTSSSTGIEPTSKQPRFTGSTRKIRGIVVRLLTQTDVLSKEEIASHLSEERIGCIDLTGILNQLVKDGLIKQTDSGKFHITQ